MYEQMIEELLRGIEDDSAGARARVLRNQPKPPPMPPPGMPPGGPMPPPPPMQPGDWSSSQQPAGQPPINFPPPQATQPLPRPLAGPVRPSGPLPGPVKPALPQAVAAQAPPPPVDADPNEPLMARQQQLLGQFNDAMTPPDRSAMEAAYGKRAQEGPRMLLHALAAERAGKGGLAKHYYGAAGEMDQPMKMAGGTMTPTGFIEDPGYAREFTIKKIEAQMLQNDRIIQANTLRAEKVAAEKRNEQLRRDLSAATLAQQRYATDLAHGDRVRGQDLTAAKAANKPGGAASTAADRENTLALLKEAEIHLPKATSSGAGALYDKGAAFFGQGTEGSAATSALRTIAGQLISKMPKMSGPQSDKDVELYKQMAGDLANPGTPRADKEAALAQIRRLNSEYGPGGAKHVPDEGEPLAPAAPARPSALPKATAPKGRLTPAEDAELAALKKQFGR